MINKTDTIISNSGPSYISGHIMEYSFLPETRAAIDYAKQKLKQERYLQLMKLDISDNQIQKILIKEGF